MSDCCSRSKSPLVWIVLAVAVAGAICLAVFGGRATDTHHGIDDMPPKDAPR